MQHGIEATDAVGGRGKKMPLVKQASSQGLSTYMHSQQSIYIYTHIYVYIPRISMHMHISIGSQALVQELDQETPELQVYVYMVLNRDPTATFGDSELRILVQVAEQSGTLGFPEPCVPACLLSPGPKPRHPQTSKSPGRELP